MKQKEMQEMQRLAHIFCENMRNILPYLLKQNFVGFVTENNVKGKIADALYHSIPAILIRSAGDKFYTMICNKIDADDTEHANDKTKRKEIVSAELAKALTKLEASIKDIAKNAGLKTVEVHVSNEANK